MSVLETQGLTRRFGELTAVDALTISVEAGEVFAHRRWRSRRPLRASRMLRRRALVRAAETWSPRFSCPVRLKPS